MMEHERDSLFFWMGVMVGLKSKRQMEVLKFDWLIHVPLLSSRSRAVGKKIQESEI